MPAVGHRRPALRGKTGTIPGHPHLSRPPAQVPQPLRDARVRALGGRESALGVLLDDLADTSVLNGSGVITYVQFFESIEASGAVPAPDL